MINKKEKELLSNIVWKNAKNIANLIVNKDIKSAYIKYETTRDIANIFDNSNMLDETITEKLLLKFSEKNVNLFMESFKVNYTNYNKNEYGITEYEVLERTN